MKSTVIYAQRALTPMDEILDAAIVVKGNKISAVGQRGKVEIPQGAHEVSAIGRTLVPGFVDVHIHGAGGHDVMEGTDQALETVATTVARSGTTSFVATTVTASEAETSRSIAGIARYILEVQGVSTKPCAEVLGIHFEGPFISHVRRGVHPVEHLAIPSRELLSRFLAQARGTAMILTLAPELPGASDLLGDALAAGLVISIGHTDATFEQAEAAIAAGARHAAHVFNAMRPFSHRETGVLGAVLTSPQVSAELIADGIHVDAAAIRMLVTLKGTGHVILVSDGTAATAMPDGDYQLGPMKVTVLGGVCRNAEGKLAGSTLTLDRALRHMVALGVPLQEALCMLTLNPAKQIGVETRKGTLAPGADADIVLLDEKLGVSGVMTRGAGLS